MLVGDNLAYLETLYACYARTPANLDEHWQDFFHALDQPLPLDPRSQNRDVTADISANARPGQERPPALALIIAQLYDAFRRDGHRAALLDPLGLKKPVPPDALVQAVQALHRQEYRQAEGVDGDTQAKTTPNDLLTRLQAVYTETIGAEFMHLDSRQEREWLAAWLERDGGRRRGSASQRRRILASLTAAEGLERYLQTQYVGQKRFSLEGGEALIALLDTLVAEASAHQAEEIIMGMAHRGRLNVLVNVLGKSARSVFDAFEDNPADTTMPPPSSGDVKYHLGYATTLSTAHGSIRVVLQDNPSHLEIVAPVVVGSARARQDLLNDVNHERVIALMIHGDASLTGQGVVMELLQMSQLRGYHVGGTIHLVINNQIGFTTADQLDGRSTHYCTDVAKMIGAPVFHVNGDDPDAVVFVCQLACAYRHRFKKDVFVDLVCYRRRGHNEADEPTITQPHMYQAIHSHPTVRALYAQRLEREGVIDPAEADRQVQSYRQMLMTGQAGDGAVMPVQTNQAGSTPARNNRPPVPTDIGKRFDLIELKALALRLYTPPQSFSVHPQVGKIYQQRRRMADGLRPIDWGFAETLAYATALHQGLRLRLSGEDVCRGTFAHRHVVLHDQQGPGTLIPLQDVAGQPEHVWLIDSLLSEEAVLAFEYGYASTATNTLSIWEAQFGDFFNGAQVVIDQFIAAGEAKWGQTCGLVLLLPHGHEGQGPEHSSARLERFLQLCACENMQVCIPTTPAQFFHLIRRQTHLHVPKPLIIMTPKSLLRHPEAGSSLQDLASGSFAPLIVDPCDHAEQPIDRIILCSGKVYYDLRARLKQQPDPSILLIRIEQLYPFPSTQLAQAWHPFSQVKTVVWCQEEPQNQGAWLHIRHALQACLSTHQVLHYAGRAVAAAPATGRMKEHLAEQHALVEHALFYSFLH